MGKLLSVITVNFNDCNGLSKTIDSVICQTARQDIEFIVIDGGSTDGGKDVLVRNQSGIDYWVSEPDKGIYNAMNKGVNKASGEYCIFMNSGDIFYSPNVVEDVFKKASGADIICGNTVTVETTKKAVETISLEYLFNSSICHQCAFIRTSLMKKHLYDEKYRIVADRKFFLQALIIDNCSYEPVDVDVVYYDIGGFSALNPMKSRLEYAQVLEELIPERIRADYGKRTQGSLYGDSEYNKLFCEIGLRNFRKPVYALTVALLSFVSLFIKSASFVKNFPKRID